MNLKYFLFFLLFILLMACGRKVEETQDPNIVTTSDEVVFTPAQESSAGIKTGRLEERFVSATIKVSGRLEAPPQNIVTISVPFAGFVKSTELLPGMTIKRGQLIAEMQHPDYIQFQQDYLELKGQLEFLEAEYKRQAELAKESINSEKLLQQSKANYMSALAKVQGLKSKLQLMNLNLGSIEKGEFNPTMNLYSPIDGFVTEMNVNPGKYVLPTDPMFKIVSTQHLHAELRVFEKDIMNITKGQVIVFTLGGDTTKRIAEVYLVGREIGADRTIEVHGHLVKEEPGLIPGMYLTGEIKTNPSKAMMLPRQAVVSHEGTPYIFIAIAPQRYKGQVVKTGVEREGWIEVVVPSVHRNQDIVVEGAYALLSKIKNGPPEF